MKLNPKVYKQLTNEPFDSQVVNGKTVEFHYMNDTPFLFQFASRGRFAIWTSDGQNYRVLVEKAYYEALKDFYQPEVNEIWLNFLEKVSGVSKKVNMWFIIPTLVSYVVVAGLATIFFQDQMLAILLGLIVLVVISNIFQSRIVNNKVKMENQSAQNKIRTYVGDEAFDELVKAQEVHYQAYFKFDEEEQTDDFEQTDSPSEAVIDEENKDKKDEE